MNTTQIVYEYHDRTKHHPKRYAASRGHMDWSIQPDPFRRYSGAELIALPLIDENDSPTYAELFDSSRSTEPLSIDTLAQLLQYSMGLAAWKSIGSDSWALRCNASSGNLHPTEVTLILPPLEGISSQSVIAHYAPKEHALEILASFESSFWDDLPQGALLLGISSILWREVWKYGERAFRYTQLDAGHAQQAITLSAKLANWTTRRIDDISISDLDQLLGLDQAERYHDEEREVSDMLLLISPKETDRPKITQLLQEIPKHLNGSANRLSHGHHYWEAIELIERATHVDPVARQPIAMEPAPVRKSQDSAKSLLHKRRSAQAMDPRRASITKETFMRLLASINTPLEAVEPAADLILFLHAVDDLPQGLYLLLRNKKHLEALKTEMMDTFVWQEVESDLFLLEQADLKAQAKFISCAQDIASDSAFSLGMLSEFRPQIEAFGAQRYKELYWECGAIGQQLYVEATALGLSATGIGCYLDDVMHRLLGLSDNRFQVLYHFTIGQAIVDMRLKTLPPYAHLDRGS